MNIEKIHPETTYTMELTLDEYLCILSCVGNITGTDSKASWEKCPHTGYRPYPNRLNYEIYKKMSNNR